MLTVVGLDLVREIDRLSIACGILLLTLVPIVANRRIGLVFRQEEVLAPTTFDRFLRKKDPDGSYRTVGESLYRARSELQVAHQSADPGGLDWAVRNWEQYSHSLWGRGTVLQADFDHGDLSRLESLRELAYRASTFLDSEPFFGAIALRWGIRYRDQESLGGYSTIRSLGIQEWDENPRALPDLRLLQKWKEEPNALRAVGVLPRLTDGEVVLETGVSRAGSAREGKLEILDKTPERLVVRAEVADPTWLFVLRGYWTHRDVRVDGVPVEPVAAQLAFCGVPIPAGTAPRRVGGGPTGRRCFALGSGVVRPCLGRSRGARPPIEGGLVTRPGRMVAAVLLVGAAGVSACSRRKPELSQIEKDMTRPAEEWLQQEPVRLLRDYVRIDTTTGSGGDRGRAVSPAAFSIAARSSRRSSAPRPGAATCWRACRAAGEKARFCSSTTSTSSEVFPALLEGVEPLRRRRSSSGSSTGAAPTT